MSVRYHPTKNRNLPPGEPKYYQIEVGYGDDRYTIVKQFDTPEQAQLYDNKLKRGTRPKIQTKIAPTFKEMLPDFLHYYEHELERRPRAIEAWLQGWANLAPHFANLKPNYLSPTLIEDYKAFRLSQKAGIRLNLISKRTVQKELHNLSSFIKFAVEKHHAEPLTFKIKGFLKKNMTPKPVIIPTPEQIAEMFEATRKRRPDLLPLYQLIYYTGFRSTEARTIKRENINFEQGIILIQGKGGKWRFMPIVDKLLPILTELCKGKKPEDYLLISKRTKKIYTPNIGRMGKAAESAGITEHITAHVLRKCFGTHCLYWGIDMRTVQVLLGHEDIKTTETYTPLPQSFLTRQLQRFGDTPTKTPDNYQQQQIVADYAI